MGGEEQRKGPLHTSLKLADTGCYCPFLMCKIRQEPAEMLRGDTSRRMHPLPSSGGRGRFRGIWNLPRTLGSFLMHGAGGRLSKAWWTFCSTVGPASSQQTGGSRASTCARGRGCMGNRPCPGDNV